MDEVGLGRILQDARKKAGYTQQELCQKASLSYSTLAKIERGAIKSPSIFTIQSIADALHLSLDELIGNGSPDKAQVSDKKVSKNGVRFVFFDINGCLVRFYHRAFSAIAADSGKQADMIETLFWHYNDDVCRGQLSMDEFNKILGSKFSLPNFDWQKYYLEAVDAIPEMVEVLQWAKDHYSVGLLSNIMPGLVSKLVSEGLLPDIKYDVIIDSSEVGVIKPDTRIYEIAQQRAASCTTNASSEIQPGEILFVDDSRANIMAAEKLGWKVLWFDDYRPDESAARVRASLEF